LEAKLKKFNSRSLDVLSCVEIYQIVFDTFVEVIKATQVQLTNEAMNYVSQSYYDGIIINGSTQLNPNIFTQRAKLENIPTSELLPLAALLQGTEFVQPVIVEIKKRN
jgi:hypothetical protein